MGMDSGGMSDVAKVIRRDNQISLGCGCLLVLVACGGGFLFSRRAIPFDRDAWVECSRKGKYAKRWRMKDDVLRMLNQKPGMIKRKVLEMLGPPDASIMPPGGKSLLGDADAFHYRLGYRHLTFMPGECWLIVKFGPDRTAGAFLRLP